jgi:hypothetical protein
MSNIVTAHELEMRAMGENFYPSLASLGREFSGASFGPLVLPNMIWYKTYWDSGL